MHLILHRSKEILGELAVEGIIHGGGIDVRDFLIETALTGTNFLNLGNQVFKIVFIKNLTVDEPAFVQNISLLGKSVQHLCCPLSELRCPAGVDTVADCKRIPLSLPPCRQSGRKRFQTAGYKQGAGQEDSRGIKATDAGTISPRKSMRSLHRKSTLTLRCFWPCCERYYLPDIYRL